MSSKTFFLFLLAVCFVIITKASNEDLSSVHVTKEKLDMHSKRVLAKLQKNQKTLKDAFKSIDRKQRTVPSKFFFGNNAYIPLPYNTSYNPGNLSHT